jgi:hypothetical protein
VIIVSPYKPIPPERAHSDHTREKLGDFDWVDALRMLAASAARFDYPVYAITDTELPVPHYRFNTVQPDLMIWILEVSLAYLSSEYFTEDTAFICPDSLVNEPCMAMTGFDLAIAVRFEQKHAPRPILNSVQLWPVAAKAKLIDFYTRCMEYALASPQGAEWGGDTVPLEKVLAPLDPGLQSRAGLNVLMLPHERLLRTINSQDIRLLDEGMQPGRKSTFVIDFKYTRKKHMQAYFEATR